jgi:hypothetical protein
VEKSTPSTNRTLDAQRMIKRWPVPDAASHVDRTDNAMIKSLDESDNQFV